MVSSRSIPIRNNVLITTLVSLGTAAVSYSIFQYYRRRRAQAKGLDFDFNANLGNDDNKEAILLMMPMLEQAAEMARKLSPSNGNSMSPNDQLMIYGLYKQAKFGDCNVPPPSKLRVKEYAKYTAWTKFKTMPQHFAIMKYVEVVQHFASLGNDSTAGTTPSLPSTNYTFIDPDDNDDIIYEEDDDDIDVDHYDDDDDDFDNDNKNKTKDNEIQETSGLGIRQSTPLFIEARDDDDNNNNGKGNDKIMAILKAATDGNTTQLQKRLEEKNENLQKEINQADEETGQTPLHMAADKGHTDCVSMLLKANADPNAMDDAGISVLTAAVFGGSVDVVKLLLEHGANPDQEDEDGDTPRSCAEEGDCEVIRDLFQNL